MCYSLVAIGLIGLLAQEAPPPGGGTPQEAAPPANDVAVRLRAEAVRLESGHASDFFEALIKAARSGGRDGVTAAGKGPTEPTDQMPYEAEEFLRGSGSPARLIEQADRTARDALRFWLARALAPGSKPPRLEDWQRLRASVVGHAEAVILEGVLRPEEARYWRGRATRPLMPKLVGRYSIIPIKIIYGYVPTNYTRASYFSVIHQQQFETRSSTLFGVLLGYVLPEEPNMFGARPAQSDLRRFPGLSPDQARLLEGLDLLARKVRRYWWLRDVEVPPEPLKPDPKGIRELPPTPAMELRLSDQGKLVRASIVAHIEEIALEAVLTPAEAEPAKRELWRQRGVHALLDPELAARLRLTRIQREELAESLTGRRQIYEKMEFGVAPLEDNRIPPAVRRVQKERWEKGKEEKIAALDQPIWEILNPSQLRALAGLLNKPVAGYDPPKPKATAKRGGREG
jgi:hypothetical protein